MHDGLIVLERPDVDSISGNSNPIIAIEQKTTGRNPRSPLGQLPRYMTSYETALCGAANAYSPATGEEMIKYTDDQIVNLIIEQYNGKSHICLHRL